MSVCNLRILALLIKVKANIFDAVFLFLLNCCCFSFSEALGQLLGLVPRFIKK